MHSGYGPLCIETKDLAKAAPLKGEQTTAQVIALLHNNIKLWLGDEHVQGACSCCAMAICNIFLNIMYHNEVYVNKANQPGAACYSPRNLGSWALTPRPQAGFVLPKLSWRKGTRKHSLLDVVSGHTTTPNKTGTHGCAGLAGA